MKCQPMKYFAFLWCEIEKVHVSPAFNTEEALDSYIEAYIKTCSAYPMLSGLIQKNVVMYDASLDSYYTKKLINDNNYPSDDVNPAIEIQDIGGEEYETL